MPQPIRKFKNSATGSEFTVEQVQEMIDKIEAEARGLTEWEQHFINDMVKVFPRTANLSEKQLEVIERIYAAKTN